jgi:hypothetical protein
VAANAVPFADLLARLLQNGAQARRAGHEETVDLLFVLNPKQHRDGPTVARHDRPLLAGLQERLDLLTTD